METTLHILVVDDHQTFRTFVSSILRENPNWNAIGEVEDGPEAVQQAEALQPDLILLDIGLPGLNGKEAARRMGELAPNSRIVFLTQESSSDVVHAALDLGALGYVIKAHAARDLLIAVESGMRGH